MNNYESLKVVHVKLQKIFVSSFLPRDNQVTLEIYFEDGKNKQITKTTTLKEPSLLALQLMEELVLMEKNINLDFDGETLTGNTHIVIDEEQTTQALLIDFFQTLYSKAQKLKKMKDSVGYMDMLRDIQRTRLII